jgi:SHS2 domain-containing protein
MKQYEPFDISGDAGLKAYGMTKEAVFINSAIGMFSLITDLNLINEKKNLEVAVQGTSLESLLVSWLNELIFYFDTYGFVGKSIKNNQIVLSEDKLHATVSGEDFVPGKHESRLLIKAATYHRLKIEKRNKLWQAQVIFDI